MPLALVIVLGVLLLVIKQCQKKNEPEPKPKVTNNTKKYPSSNVNRNRGFDRRISYLEYSEHAKCRMSCRHISQSEVEDIMQNGTINYNKSEIQNARCPRYALEGITQDNQRVRIVFAQCDYKTEVVTVIDLGREWSCDCPGDENKYKNKN